MRTVPSHSPIDAPSIVSCVVDNAPGFQQELLRWFASATTCAAIEPHRLVIHAVRPGNSDVVRLVETLGAHVVPIDSFDARSPHCNKISGALALARNLSPDVGSVALLDTDMLVLADPNAVAPPAGTIAGKRVDLANPPLSILEAVFAAASLPLPSVLPPPAETLSGNFNGGLYVLSGSDLASFASTWSQWARWLLDRSTLLGAYSVHVDQVAACLAVADLGIATEELDVLWNLPTHLDREFPPNLSTPKLVHYHRRVGPDGLVEPVGHRRIDDAIREANRAAKGLRTLPD